MREKAMRFVSNIKKISYFFICLVLSFQVFAEPKQLVCKVSAEEEAQRMESINDPASAAICRKSDFGWINTFTFDTNDLNSRGGKFEISRESCNPHFSDGVRRGSMVATSSTITFIWVLPGMSDYPWNFNVDRKTLRGGQNTERNNQCTIEDVDTSENQI
jgi:hypothetical protein